MKTMIKTSAAVAALSLLAGTAAAEVTFSGFGQIVAGTSSDEVNTLYGYDDDLSFTEESLFGLQATGDMGDNLSATVQIVGRGNDDFDPEFAWAYITYRFDNSFDVRAGRIRIPFFRYSDFLDVGYAYHWTRVPSTVYGTLGFDELDGVNFGHSAFIGDWYSRAQFVAGRFNGDLVLLGQESPSDLRNFIGGSWDVSYEWFSARVAYFRTEVEIEVGELQPLLEGLSASGFPDVASNIAFDGDTGTFWGVSAEGDWDRYFLGAEIVNRKVENSLLTDADAWYVSGGTRWNAWTFHATFGSQEGEAELSAVAALPSDNPLFASAFGLVASQQSEYDYYSVGARWDLQANLALKMEYEDRNYDIGGDDAEVLSAGLMFSF